MQKYLKYILVLIIISFLIVGYIYQKNIVKEYNSNLFYMDTYINIKVFSSDKVLAHRALEEADDLFKFYHNLTDRYNENSELYLLNHTDGKLEVDTKLYNLIEYAYNWYPKSQKLFNINMGSVIDIWKKYREHNLGIPKLEELRQTDTDMNDLVLLKNNVILSKHINLDLGGIVKGYVTKLVGEKFDNLGINDYIINAGGNVLVGKKHTNDLYKIGIESPLKDGSIYQVVKGEKISVVTSGSYERYYEYDGKLYHHIINPNTLYPSDYMKSVTVICKDSAQADILSTTLFLMPIDEGKAYLKKFNDVEAIWFDNNNNIVKSEGFSKYE